MTKPAAATRNRAATTDCSTTTDVCSTGRTWLPASTTTVGRWEARAPITPAMTARGPTRSTVASGTVTGRSTRLLGTTAAAARISAAKARAAAGAQLTKGDAVPTKAAGRALKARLASANTLRA